jgi:hypothetical protein
MPKDTDAKAPESAAPAKLPERIEPWLKIVTAIGGAVAVLWGALMLFNPIGKTDLTIRLEPSIDVSLPKDLTAIPVQLVYEGKQIRRAAVVPVEILNSGRTPLGTDKRWRLDLRSVDSSTIVPLGAPRRVPSNLDVTIAPETLPAVVSLDFGLFNPGASLRLDLMMIEPKETFALPLTAETQIPGLLQPAVGRENVRQRLRNAFIIPIFIPLFLVVVVLALREGAQLKRGQRQTGWVHTVPGALFMSALFAGLVSSGIAAGLAWIAKGVLAK